MNTFPHARDHAVSRARRLLATVLCASAFVTSSHHLPVAGAEPLTASEKVSGLGPRGTSTMHGDAQSSDTTHYAGPGTRGLRSKFKAKFSACPTILADADGVVWALCTKILGRAPEALLLDSTTGDTLAHLDIAKGALLGGVYAYLDDRNRLTLVDGNRQLLKLGKKQDSGGQWHIEVSEKFNIAGFLQGDGGARQTSDAVVGLTPDNKGNIWLATAQGRVGILRGDESNHDAPRIPSLQLGEGERIDNSISSSEKGVSIATSHALYLLRESPESVEPSAAPGASADSEASDRATGKREPEVVWRREYDRGSARKPGQLSWGTGATPSFFGPEGRDDYLTITDNADGQIHLLVYRADDGALVCSEPVFAGTAGGTENSAIAHGNSVIVASTYGYPYPAVPEGAGASNPAAAPFTGGMEKIDVTANGDGCSRAWAKPIVSSAVPRLSSVDNTIYTVERQPHGGRTGSLFDAITVDAGTGEVTSRQRIARTPLRDTLEMVGTITPDGVWWQGAMTGVFRLEGKG